MVTVREVVEVLDEIAPRDLAEDWDRVGPQVVPEGAWDREVERVLVCLDVTREVAREAGEGDVVVSHHPLIFRPLGKLMGRVHSLFREVLASGAVYIAAHTNWDRAEGGVADSLARRLNLRVLREVPSGSRLCAVRDPEGLLAAMRNLSPLLRVFGSVGGWDRVLVAPGAAPREVVEEAERFGVDAVVSGEVRYHDRLELLELGVSVAELGHDFSELPGVQALARALKDKLEGVEVRFVPPPDVEVHR